MSTLSEEQIAELSRLSDDIHLRQVELKEIAAKFETLVAKAIMSTGEPLRSTALCLSCGSTHLIRSPCSRCAVK